uniref:Dehydrogenase/reductase (SDR family) member 11b n=1 Tax=Sinocyclocheilus rhinocerous TaxID=307959 RepID=A0A673KW29_9TELE
MDRWRGRVALVTGASVGIGAAIAKSLVQHGMKVVGCARNVEQIEVMRRYSIHLREVKVYVPVF